MRTIAVILALLPFCLAATNEASEASDSRQGRLLGGAGWLPWGAPQAKVVAPVSPYAVVPVPNAYGNVKYFDADAEIAASRANDERALSLFGLPLLNPLQFLTNPFALDNALVNGLALKKPFAFDFKNVVARATIAANGVAASNIQGEVVFFQEDWKKPVVVLIALTGLAANAANVVVDIRPNQDVTAACANVGAAVFNPTGALNGGVLVSGVTADAQGNFAEILRNIPIDRSTLLGATSVINRSVRVGAAGATVGCGSILKQTTPILG